MKDPYSELRQGDPLAHEAELSSADAERMRRYILSAKPEIEPVRPGLFMAVATAMLFLTAGGAVFVHLSRLPVAAPRSARSPVMTADEPARRQLQFYTPGGTRVLWTFNPDLELR